MVVVEVVVVVDDDAVDSGVCLFCWPVLPPLDDLLGSEAAWDGSASCLSGASCGSLAPELGGGGPPWSI